ncbi:hypothetical protein DFH06DRAFT_452641 [Mycena polygramma]|nr:hypothetical protein DFH06DRAFT_452641 [Mycena polygramma]
MSDSASDQYAKLLLRKCYGFPLWDPQPTEENAEYKKDGARIGDVGFLDQGAFNFLFNICLPREHPINSLLQTQHARAYNFESVRIGPNDIRHKVVAFPPKACVSTKSIRKRAVDVSESMGAPGVPLTQETNVHIACSTDEGAALVLPTGASSQDLTPLSRFRHHAHNSAAKWFKFLEEWGFAGNTLYLITGCHKSSGWGITFSALRGDQGDVNMTLGLDSFGGRLGTPGRPRRTPNRPTQAPFVRHMKRIGGKISVSSSEDMLSPSATVLLLCCANQSRSGRPTVRATSNLA